MAQRRPSSSSFLSCMDDSASHEEGAAAAAAPEVEVEDPVLNVALQKHAILEWVLGLNWHKGSTRASRSLYGTFGMNRFSKFLNPVRPNKSEVGLSKSMSVAPLYWQTMRVIDLDKYQSWISLPDSDMAEEDKSLDEPNCSLLETCRFLDSDVADSLIWDCLVEELKKGPEDEGEAEALSWLAGIHARASLAALNQHLPTARVVKMLQQGQEEHKEEISQHPSARRSLEEELDSIRSIAANYAGLMCACPTAFEYGCTALEPARFLKFLQSFIVKNYSKQFLALIMDLISQNAETENDARALLTNLWREITDRLGGRRLYKTDTGLQAVINALVQEKLAAECLVAADFFLPNDSSANGWHLMMYTFFGRLFRPSPIDHLKTGDELTDFVSVVDKYFNNLISRGTSGHNPLGNLQLVRLSHHGVIQSCVQVIKTLLKQGGICKSRTLQWLSLILESNVLFSSLRFRHSQTVFADMGPLEALTYRAQNLSTLAFGLNVVWILLVLCDPIALHKVCDLSPLYPAFCKTLKGGLLGDSITKEACIVDIESATTQKALDQLKAEDVKFTCQVFWLTLKAVRVFLIPCYNHYEIKLRKLVSVFKGSGTGEKDGALGELLCWTSCLEQDNFVNSLSHFSELACAVFLRSAFAFTSGGDEVSISKDNSSSATPLVLQQINVSLDLLPSAKQPPPQFASLPHSYISDFFSMISKMLTTTVSPIFVNSKQDATEHFMASTNAELLAASVLFILRDPSNYIRGIGLKLEGAAHILLAISGTKTMLRRFANTQCVKSAMIPSLITSFVEAQKASYYQRIDLRLLLTREFERFLPQPHFQNQINNLSKTNHEEYEKFIHFFASNTSWVLEEALSSLSEVKKREKKESALDGEVDVNQNIRNRAAQSAQQNAEMDENAEAERIAAEMEGTRNVADMPFQDLASHCKGLMEAGQLSLNVLKLIVTFSTEFIKKSDVLMTQMVLYLNSCLNSLVGPKCLTLKVTNFEMYNFKPRELLASLAFIYVTLAKNKADFDAQVVGTICSEDRFFKCELFTKASRVLQREGIVSKRLLEDFRHLTRAITEEYTETKTLDDLLADDVPAEFLDPLMAEIMRDPVLLPSSGVIVERRVIERHLISDEFDPFNRAPLKKADLVPQPELKQQIMEFIQSKKLQQ
eukprot:Gregarina_sp_Poly_1__8425@NODE_495_length_7936_cov_45_131783_g398_i0_p1_GENE_NODE_495_length_7936_cov_45_131783_g398_i0NODE_495_length_7936_cov_45_131783_g398_i0_p1_ORF_typecomplete_len1158_score187_86Ufd2P_core/PF10408_9/5_1e02Ufd2P_core/PF10408_9/1_2e94Ubox/PF04564_15/4_9e20_NODE_495_length_7936_cov_45_131783_g398_i0413514